MQTLSIPKRKRIYSIAFSPDGNEMAAASQDGYVRIWNLNTGEVRQWATLQETSCGHEVLYLDQDRLLVAGYGIQWWDIPANGWNQISPMNLWRRQLSLSPDGKYLAVADEADSVDWAQNGLFVFNTDGWFHLPRFEHHPMTTGGVAFSLDGKYLATGHMVKVGEKMRTFGLSFGPYAVNDYDYLVHLREMPSGKIIQTSDGWQQGIRAVAFSPDGRFLAGGAGPRLRIWDIEENREVVMHKRGTKHFQGVAFTADGRYLATVSNDETVRLWDTRSWQEYTTFTWNIGKLLNIAFAPDGMRAAAASDKGRIVIWDVEE